MFSGLNKTLKIILPKGLFYRSLLIVAAPIIILQIIVTVVFFDSIWIKANKGMTRSLVGEIKTLTNVYNHKNQDQIDFLTKSYKENFDYVINFLNNENLPELSERKYSPMDRSLRRELKSSFGSENYWFNTVSHLEIVEVRIRAGKNVIQFFFPKEKLATSSVRLFIMWLILPSLFLILIAIIFLKNQTKPIVNLAKAAEKFGKGDYVNEFRASGASEIRKASYEFDRMAKRINRHLNQRSEMLSGISHDLRTPLTRLKLQLTFLSQKEISKKMSKDIDEMEKMLNDYLQYAKSQAQDVLSSIDISTFFNELEEDINNRNLKFKVEKGIILRARKSALKRCFNNIIQNGLTYGKRVFVSVHKSKNRCIITFDDDGPGISAEHRVNVFKPFFRLDKSRSLNNLGVGLGLAISEDIINSHGGHIQLLDSKLNGLQVKITLPF